MLNKVSLRGISNVECRKSYGKKILDSIICVKNNGTNGAGTCQVIGEIKSYVYIRGPIDHLFYVGDSGGALLKRLDGDVFVQIGIVSFGPDKGCGREHPTGYTRISHYLDFVEEHTGIKMV